jgi:hypothetical protein
VAGVGNNGAPECRLSVVVRGVPVSVIVNDEKTPQAYFLVERTIVEDSQQFSAVRNFAAPETVGHLGLDASWIPDTRQLITTDGVSVLLATVSWPHGRHAQEIALARAAIVPYLGPLHQPH